jgi:site-specific DNA-methyltransferase (adenine-specific)
MAVRIEDAGFEIRDMIAWVYGSGFPKSLDVSKAIDKAAGAERKVVGTKKHHAGNIHNARYGQATATEYIYSDPATPEAKQWEGWGTALKPALEPITVARKPLIGTVAENVLQHGTGAINVDGCRVGTDGGTKHNDGEKGTTKNCYGNGLFVEFGKPVIGLGRWPANFIHDGSEQATDLLGASARFFYCAKASKRDRDEGNHHPTVKPTDLMRYLCRLVTPPDGTVLDPFMGSGSTGKAAVLEGFSFIGIEREAEYVAIAQARINHFTND